MFVKLSSGLIGQEVHRVSPFSSSACSPSFSFNHQHHMSIKQTELKFAPINDNTWGRAWALIRWVHQKTYFTSIKIRPKRNQSRTFIFCVTCLRSCHIQSKNLNSSTTKGAKTETTVDSDESVDLPAPPAPPDFVHEPQIHKQECKFNFCARPDPCNKKKRLSSSGSGIFFLSGSHCRVLKTGFLPCLFRSQQQICLVGLNCVEAQAAIQALTWQHHSCASLLSPHLLSRHFIYFFFKPRLWLFIGFSYSPTFLLLLCFSFVLSDFYFRLPYHGESRKTSWRLYTPAKWVVPCTISSCALCVHHDGSLIHCDKETKQSRTGIGVKRRRTIACFFSWRAVRKVIQLLVFSSSSLLRLFF